MSDETISLTDENGEELAAKQISVDVTAVLGTANLQISQLLKLGRGAVVELDRKTSDPVDLYVNRTRIAKGDVIVVEDHIAVTITDVIKSSLK